MENHGKSWKAPSYEWMLSISDAELRRAAGWAPAPACAAAAAPEHGLEPSRPAAGEVMEDMGKMWKKSGKMLGFATLSHQKW